MESEKYYLYVPYEMKDKAREVKCKWDKDKKSWYCEPDNARAKHLFAKRYKDIPYDDKDEYKKNGWKWDPDERSWYTYYSNQFL